MRWPRCVFIIGMLLAGSVGCESGVIGREWQRLDPAIPAPEFTLPQLDGKAVTLSDYRDGVVIMEFWATWCGSCRESTPSLDVIYRRYRDRGVAVLLINEGEPSDRVRAWLEGRFAAPVLLDQDGRVAARYHLSSVPRLLVIDHGRILYDRSGYRGGLEQNLSLILDELLPHARPTPHP